MPETAREEVFRLFNEIGIIAQLSRALLEARLPPGFLLPHFTVLNHLVRVADGRTPLELARAFQVPKTSMTHTLGGLARAELVDIRANPRDGRSKRVFITAAGRSFLANAIAALGPDLDRIAAAQPPGSLRDVLPTLETMRKFLDEDRDDQRAPPPPHSAEDGGGV